MYTMLESYNPRFVSPFFLIMSTEPSVSSVNELLIPSAEENEKKAEVELRWPFLPARLFLIIIDIGIALCGVDIGFFGCG